MPRGRKPKPPQLKLIEGNPGKRKIPEIVKPEIRGQPPKCPAWLVPEAKKEWKRIAKVLHETELLSELDVAALAAYCQSYARYIDAERKISQAGEKMVRLGKFGVSEVLRPEVYYSKMNLNFVRLLCSEFGLSPSARARMVLPGEKEEDPFDDFLKEGQRRSGAG